MQPAKIFFVRASETGAQAYKRLQNNGAALAPHSGDGALDIQDELLPLLQRTARGDRPAFKNLYDHTSGRLYAVALRMLRQRDAAEEVMQEAYVRIWHNAADYLAERGSVLTWMISILRYRAIDRMRRSRPEVPFEPGSEADGGGADESQPDPFAMMQNADETRLLMGCMEELGDVQRRSIALAFYDGLTHEQLSARFDAPLGTVKSWIRRGLLSLRRCLER